MESPDIDNIQLYILLHRKKTNQIYDPKQFFFTIAEHSGFMKYTSKK